MDIRIVTYLINIPDEAARCNLAYLRVCDTGMNCVSEGTTMYDLKGSGVEERNRIWKRIGYA